MNTCAVYARYSSDLQRDSSIEDQVRRCEEFAKQKGWTVVKRYCDRAVSGTTVAGREQLQWLLLKRSSDQGLLTGSWSMTLRGLAAISPRSSALSTSSSFGMSS